MRGLIRLRMPVIGNFISLSFIELGNRAANHLVFFLSAYYLLANDFGVFSGYRAISQVLVAVFDLGLAQAIVFFEHKNNNKTRLSLFFSIKLWLYVPLTLFIGTWWLFAYSEIPVTFAVAILGISLLDDVAAYVSSYHYRNSEFIRLGIIRIVPKAIFCFIVIVLPAKTLSTVVIAWLLSSISVVGYLATGLGKIELRQITVPSWKLSKILFAKLSPIYLAGLSGALIPNADLLVLAMYGLHTEAGNFNIAYRVAAFFVLPATMLFSALIPTVLSDSTRGNRDVGSVAAFLGKVSIFGFVAAVAYAYTLEPINVILFSGKFREASQISALLAASVFFLYVWGGGSYILLSQRRVASVSAITLAVACVKVPLDFAMVKIFGWEGAAYATVIADMCSAVLVLGYLAMTNKWTDSKCR